MTDLEDTSVSICVASYNMADTIEESLRSIVENLPPNFEVVIVDNSTDGSREVIEAVDSDSHLTFRTIHTPFPMGVGHARNLAVCEATGDIVVTHVDADDWYDSRFFSAFVELYLELREARGSDFFFSCPNMNISSREHIMGNYLLTSLPIGANEREYRWRAYRNGDFLQLRLADTVSERIALSDRKTIVSRMRRTYARHLGLYRIGYDSARIVREDILERPRSLPSRLFRGAIIPVVWLHSLFVPKLCHAPVEGKTLPEAQAENTYSLGELRRQYEIDDGLLVDEMSAQG